MKQPPFFDKDSDDNSEKLWAYIEGKLSVSELAKLESELKNSDALSEKLQQYRILSESLNSYQQQAAPEWKPEYPSKKLRPLNRNNWLTMAIAATALVISLLPYIHFNENNVALGAAESAVSTQQLQQVFADFQLQQTNDFSNKLEQLRAKQMLTNQQLLLSLLNYTEKRRRNDLLQMASWFSRQSELNQNQQRQIVNWVANEQQQDQQAISALFNSINSESHSEVQP